MQQAIDLPNLYARGEDFYGEITKLTPEILGALARRGVVVKAGRGEESGLHGVIVRDGGQLEGGADPRREGQWQAPGPR
jgi:gamma-glutamyltranspeptidase/glutathione hydrolase